MKAALTVINANAKEQYTCELNEMESIKRLSKCLSLKVNQKRHKNIRTIKINDYDFKENGIKIRIHYKNDQKDIIYNYYFTGKDIAYYYNN